MRNLEHTMSGVSPKQFFTFREGDTAYTMKRGSNSFGQYLSVTEGCGELSLFLPENYYKFVPYRFKQIPKYQPARSYVEAVKAPVQARLKHVQQTLSKEKIQAGTVKNFVEFPNDNSRTQVADFETQAGSFPQSAVGGGEGGKGGINGKNKFEEKIPEGNKFNISLKPNLNSNKIESGKLRDRRKGRWLGRGLTVNVNEYGKRRVFWEGGKGVKQAGKWVNNTAHSISVGLGSSKQNAQAGGLKALEASYQNGLSLLSSGGSATKDFESSRTTPTILEQRATSSWVSVGINSASAVTKVAVDANQFVADEDDVTYSCRVSGALLLEEVVNAYGREGIDAIMNGAKQHFRESQQKKVSGSTVWWRTREATLFALASLSEQLVDLEVSGPSRVDVGKLVEQIVTEDIGIGVHEYPFLYARIFTSVAKFSPLIGHGVLEHILYAAIKAIGMDVPPPVKVGACRALSQLLPEANKELIRSQMMGLFSSLTDLLNQASDETLHLVLETLQAVIKAGSETSTSVEPIISPIILNVWALHISDPFISIDALEVLEAIKNSPGCIHPLTSRVLPYIGPILNKPQQQPDGLVAGSLDLVTMLLKNAPIDVVKAVHDVCFDAVIWIVLQSDDHSEMQNATECLAAFVSGGREEVLTWSGDSRFTMRSLLDAASRLLDPKLESSGSLFVGSYILQLILNLPSQMSLHIRDLVAALVRRMQSVQIVGLKSSLLLIFARLVHMSSPNVEQFIDLLTSIPAEGYDNSFSYVMSEWTKQQSEIQGAYQIKVTTSALALLLSTRHAELTKTNVQGHLVKFAAGITTRSKAKLAPDQWTMVSLPAKILALLADALIEIREQDLADDDDDDSDWEEIQAGDAEMDKDLLHSLSATSSGRPTYEHLEAMEKVFNKDHEDDYEADQLCAADPLNQINLARYLRDFLMNFCQSNRPLFENLCQSLTESEQDAIQMVLNH
nr:importin-9 [Quercus suber]